MLMDEHAAQLSPEARRMLAVIAARTKRMGDMIDDLLTFSRTGRQAIVHARIDMNDLVRGVVAELVPSESRTSITVNDLPPVLGDSALIRQVWINLIANAVKFSSGVERPTVTIGARTERNSVVYWITDNGVGFDMTYRHKLFGVFERLHSQEEFEGTGVGLAIVARVIKRHGGRIWAEGQPGRGATFYFEIPIDPPSPA
jgi:light-regulated signal transduction histidine kinase (bacteriophytochrome)